MILNPIQDREQGKKSGNSANEVLVSGSGSSSTKDIQIKDGSDINDN